MATFKELNAKIETLETTVALLQPAAQISVAAQARAQLAEQQLAAQHWALQALCAHINALVEPAQACARHFDALSAALTEGHLLRARKERQRLATSWSALWAGSTTHGRCAVPAPRAGQRLTLLRTMCALVDECPLGWHNDTLIIHQGTTEAQVIAWLQQLVATVRGAEARLPRPLDDSTTGGGTEIA